MEPPTGVHPLTQTVEREVETLIIHPAAVETPKGLVLVDVGIAGAFDGIEAELADAGLSIEEVAGVVLTHHDGDHAGALREAVDRTDATVYAHERCAPHVDGREEPVKSPGGERYPPKALCTFKTPESGRKGPYRQRARMDDGARMDEGTRTVGWNRPTDRNPPGR